MECFTGVSTNSPARANAPRYSSAKTGDDNAGDATHEYQQSFYYARSAMDLLSRLVGGAGSPANKQTNYNSPEQRSIRFKKVYDQLQQIWRRSKSPTKRVASAEPVLLCLVSLRKMLQDEAQTPTPHLCARHMSTFQLYSSLAQMASTYYNEPLIHETLDIFKTLVDSEELDFLEDNTFADALIAYISKISTTGPLMVSVDTEAKIVEVLFGVSAKLRLQPKFLSSWFRPNAQSPENAMEGEIKGPNTRIHKDEFPLFYLTLDYVHHDGRVGDFARTGLLYIIESAGHSEALEKWIVESDLATLMASGLGALYSQLSRKLVFSFAQDSMPAIMSFSQISQKQPHPHAEKTTSPDFQAHLTTFLSHLVFWQDVLEHCGSSDIKQSLLDHFKFLFLQQLLYPSLIESSDVDGGSSVAVLTYLRCIIESIDNTHMIHITLQYLLALPEAPLVEAAPTRPTALARRRKSQTLISNLAHGQEKPLPDLFTLVDLVITSLRSHNQQTVTATLRLVSVILHGQHQYAISSIVKAQPSNDGLPTRTIHAHNRDTGRLFSMAEDLISHDALGEAYEAHLEDAQTLIESHCCSARILPLPGSSMSMDSITAPMFSNEQPGPVQPHSIRLEDSLLSSMISLLKDFLTNDIGTNLSLTKAISTLASCGNTCLEPWLLGDHVEHDGALDQTLSLNHGLDESDHDDTPTLSSPNDSNVNAETDPKSEGVKATSHKKRICTNTTSPIFAALDSLVARVQTYRQDIENFDTYLAERLHVFKVGKNIDNAVSEDSGPRRRSEEATAITSQAGKGGTEIGSIQERLLSESPSTTISRSISPRGRQPSNSSTSTLAGTLNHLRISPSPSPSKLDSRPFSPSPLGNDSTPLTPPRRVVIPTGPADILRQKIKIKSKLKDEKSGTPDIGSSETSSVRSGSVAPEGDSAEETQEVTLSHLLTNVFILQEFVLELAAIVQIRASLFGEVEFV